MIKGNHNSLFIQLAGIVALGFLAVFFQNCQKNIPTPNPTVSFTVSSLTCTAPCSVTFTNMSQNAVSYEWDFDDGQRSVERSPVHSYTQTGSYTVSLTATATVGTKQTTKQILSIIRPTDQWTSIIGGSGSDQLYDMIATADAGYLLVGGSTSPESTDKTKNTNYPNHGWIVKIGGDGRKQWDRDYGDDAPPVFTSIAPATDGGYLLVGLSSIVKINPYGVQQWNKSFFPGGLRRVVSTVDGGYLLGGSSSDSIVGDKSEPSQGKTDYWILKISASGEKQWDKTYGGNSMDDLQSIITTTDGGFLLSGASNSSKSGDKSEDKRGTADFYDFWVVKVSASGQKQWDKTYGGVLADVAYSALATSDGGYLIGGVSLSYKSDEKSENSRGKQDFWVIKITSNGTKQWDKTYGGDDHDAIRSMLVTPDSGFLLGGYSTSKKSGEKSESVADPGNNEFWLVKINSNGMLQWDKGFRSGGRSSSLSALLSTFDNGYLLGGDHSSYLSPNYADYWVVKIK